MNKPKYVKIGEKKYPINTDFRIALECNNIATDTSIGDYERALAIIYKLFGDEGLECDEQGKLLELGMKYLNMGTESQKEAKKEQKHELDISKCVGLIKSSFKFDYGYDPYDLDYLHWYDYYNDLSNLSNSEFGTCCALSRIASIINMDVKEIKDSKERRKAKELQDDMIKKYCYEEKPKITQKQRESAKEFYKSLGINL